MRYIVRNATEEQVRKAGGRDIRVTRAGIFVTLTEEQRRILESQGAVVRKTGEVKAGQILLEEAPAAGITFSPVEISYASGVEELRQLTTPPLTGEGINIAVIGSGIRETHEQVGEVVYRKNYVEDEPHEDLYDHETGVASIIGAVAPGAKLLDLKVINKRGEGTDEDVVLALDHLADLVDQGFEYAPNIVNLSLGGRDTGDPDDPMRVMCRELISRRVFVFAAVGNDGPYPGTVASPACERYVFGVGSVDPIVADTRITSFTISNFSSRGPTKEGLVKPDGIFFGRGIEVASSKSDTATVVKSGTSFSCPFASGAFALFLEGERYWGGRQPPSWWFMVSPLAIPYPLTPQGLVDVFMPMIGVKPSDAPRGKDNDYGWGMPYGPLVLSRLRAQQQAGQVMDLGLNLIGLGMMGMLTIRMVKAVKGG